MFSPGSAAQAHAANRERIGYIEDVALGKLDGKVACATLSFGGFLGIGEKYHPLPWSVLTYDPEVGGYVVSLSRDELMQAPAYSNDELEGLGESDERVREPVYGYYGSFGAAPYWL